MAAAGAARGFYLLAAEGARNATGAAAGSFLRACPPAAALLLVIRIIGQTRASQRGLFLAAISGAAASEAGYALWCMTLKGLSAARAAIVQLTVPVIAVAGGVAFPGGRMSWRLVLASAGIPGGAGPAILGRQPNTTGRPIKGGPRGTAQVWRRDQNS